MSNEIMKPAEQNNFLASFNAETMEEKVALFNAISNANSLEDMIGKKIELANIIMQPVETTDRETGEIYTRPRIVLITPKNEAYACMSHGVETSLANIFAIFGEPPFDPPLIVTPEKKQGNNGYRFTTLNVSLK